MFKRLNTGGARLTDQQLRNCTIRLLDPTFNDFIIKLADDNQNFKTCTSTISEEQTYGAYDKELVLRFFALKNWLPKFKHDVDDFMTEYMEAVSDPDNPEIFDYAAEENVFSQTFAILATALDDKAFSRANKTKNDLIRAFGVYHYEAFTIGLQPFLNKLDITTADGIGIARDLLISIKLDPAFIDLTTGGGKNSPGPLKARIKFVEDKLAAAL